MSWSDTRRRVRKTLLGVVFFGAGLLAAWEIVVPAWFRWRALAACARTRGPMPAFAARYPAEPDSPALLRLDAMTRAVGIWLILDDQGSVSPPNQDLLKAMDRAVSQQALSATDDVAPLPEPVRALLDRERVDFDRIESQILDGGPITWRRDLPLGFDAPRPAILGVKQIQAVLLTRALDALHERDDARARRSLEAAWRMSAALCRQPAVITLLMALHANRLQSAVVRCLRHPDAWRERLERLDAFAAGLDALQFEAYAQQRFAARFVGTVDVGDFDVGPPSGALAFANRLLTSPYVRASMYDGSARLAALGPALQKRNACLVSPAVVANEILATFPAWSRIDRDSVSSLANAWTALRDAALQSELTVAVLRAREGSVGPMPSTFCPGFTWTQSADGSTVTTALDRTIVWKPPADARLAFHASR